MVRGSPDVQQVITPHGVPLGCSSFPSHQSQGCSAWPSGAKGGRKTI